MFAQIPRYRRSMPCPTPNTKPMQLRLFVRIFIMEQPQGVTWGSTLEEEHTCSILWNMSSVPQLGELRWGYILWLCARWNKFWVGLRYLNFRPSFMRSVDSENSGLRWWCWTSRMEKKKRLGASSYCTIYAVLIFVFRRVGIPCHAMCCEQIMIFNSGTARGSFTRRGRLWQAVAFQLAWFVESTKDFLMISDPQDGYLLICGLRAFRIVVLSEANIVIGSFKDLVVFWRQFENDNKMLVQLRLKKHQENYTWLIQDWAYITWVHTRSLRCLEGKPEYSPTSGPLGCVANSGYRIANIM